MLDFLASYTIADMVIFIAALGCLVAAIYSFVKKGRNEYQTFLQDKLEQDKQKQQWAAAMEKIDRIAEVVTTLRESDKSRIKGEILREHDMHTAEGYVDARTLEYLEQQFSCYEKEGGNSFVASLMNDLRELPIKEKNGHKGIN